MSGAREVLLAGCALSLAACATPTYPVKTGYAAPPPIKPRYSTEVPAALAPAAPPPPVAQAAPPPAAEPVPTPEAPVESQPLPPATGGPALSVPTPSPAQTALPPDYSPPSPTEEAQQAAPPPSTYRAAPPVYQAPQVRYHAAPARYVADGKVVAATGMFRDYEVQKHDHLDAIARDLQTTRKVLVDANHLKSPYDLQPGQHLKAPVAKAYVIASGDTMSAVAKRFGVSPGELADLNDLPVRGRLRGGDKLALPANFNDHGHAKLPTVMVAEAVPIARPVASTPVYRPPVQSYPVAGEGRPYVPSPGALAAAQRLAVARSYGPPTYVPGRPSPNAGIVAAPPSRAYAYTPPAATPAMPALSQTAVAQAGKGRFIWPVRGAILSPFGVMGVGRRNDGVDVKSPQGTVVVAAAAGNVVYAGDQVPGFGNLVLVKHADGWVTAYAHLDKVSVQMRQSVTQGQELGQVGQTGGVAEPQLHFEVRYAPTPADKARPVDPLLVLPN
ncbi:MAG: LysM peptidoglycan-binding domain-containing M23 family metallopeptidase [Caulobacteraceae bacterium]